MVGNPEDRFSQNEAHMVSDGTVLVFSKVYFYMLFESNKFKDRSHIVEDLLINS